MNIRRDIPVEEFTTVIEPPITVRLSLCLCLSTSQEAKLRAAAAADGSTVSDYVAKLVRESLDT